VEGWTEWPEEDRREVIQMGVADEKAEKKRKLASKRLTQRESQERSET